MCEEPPSPGLRKGIQGTLDFGYDPRRPSAGRRGEAHHATHARAASYGCFSELFSELFKRTSVPHSIGVGLWSIDTSHKSAREGSLGGARTHSVGFEGSMLSLDGIPLLGTLDRP